MVAPVKYIIYPGMFACMVKKSDTCQKTMNDDQEWTAANKGKRQKKP